MATAKRQRAYPASSSVAALPHSDDAKFGSLARRPTSMWNR